MKNMVIDDSFLFFRSLFLSLRATCKPTERKSPLHPSSLTFPYLNSELLVCALNQLKLWSLMETVQCLRLQIHTVISA